MLIGNMLSDIANKFQEITKFDLRQYFLDYADFMRNQFPSVRSYYAGEVEFVDGDYLNNLQDLVKRSENLLRLFTTFAAKFGNVGYWELQNYCQDLYDTIFKVTILPKYLRTSKTSRGYKPYIQIDYTIGGMSDFKDIAQRINDDKVTESSLILNNDLEEQDYEIDELKSAKAFVDNQNPVNAVETILEEPVGQKVYGRDINKDITFSNNDLSVVEWQDNVNQKVKIILEMIQGDVPEMPSMGRRKVIGENVSNYSYPELVRDLQDSFLQDDLFVEVDFEDLSVVDGDIYATVNVKTKYIYNVKTTIKL